MPQPPSTAGQDDFGGRRRPIAAVTSRIPTGTLAVGAGLIVLGATSYGFLALAARTLDPLAFAALSVVWTVLFTVGPGIFLPLEQEISRRLAVLNDAGAARVLLRRAAMFGGVLCVVITGITFGLTRTVRDHLLNGESSLFLALVCANLALAPVHFSRGILAGTGRFGRYGAQLGLDGMLRVLGAAVLVALAVHRPGPFGWILVGAQLMAVAVTLWGVRLTGPRVAAAASEVPDVITLARGMSWMLAGTLGAQILANAGPLVVKALAAPNDAGAGHFLTALVLARIPLFLFAALQASLLPGLAKLVDAGDDAAVYHAMRRLLVLLAALGAFGSLLLAAVGPDITALLFGAGYRSPRAPLVILSIGCTVYMLAGALAQLLLAQHRQTSVAIGWWAGVIGFAVALAVPNGLPVRVSMALVVGCLVSGAWFAWSLRGSRPIDRPVEFDATAVVMP